VIREDDKSRIDQMNDNILTLATAIEGMHITKKH